ncbi:hypothetical protein L6E12_29155 [Actinokineospora sp. PR83]|uniref:hypothetical protein n=1 Tax=Actinokineospora sp. PR83 TaxID=2884908 RepID=UPI001F1F96AE|nr:hypothetical protein [Actinokineospora sp. PR83]MCG8919848.1 hypothetical protein [Actinokineospora sp. PR83]
MRTVGIVAAGVAVMLVGLSGGPAQAQPAERAQQPTFSSSVSPTSGPAGTAFTVHWGSNAGALCKTVTFSTALTTIPPTPYPDLQVGVVAPASAAPSTYSITLTCDRYTSVTRFTVTKPATTAPTTPPVTTTPPPVVTPTTPPRVTTPPVTTTPPRTTTTTTAPVTTTTVPITTTTTAPPTSTTLPPITTADAPEGDLRLDRESVQPGDDLSAEGEGCTPGAPVVLTSGGQRVGSTTADAAGGFTAGVEFTRVEPGRHTITAECGVVLTGAVDQIVTSSTGGSSGTLVVLVFFVLVGAALVRFA